MDIGKPQLPTLPDTGYCKWSYEPESRVLYANFRINTSFPVVTVTPEDESFLLRMMEQDDITVISEGLADGISAKLWTREYIMGCIGSQYHHKVRAFQQKARSVSNIDIENNTPTKTIEYHEEKQDWYSMKFSSYFEYLDKRRNLQEMWKQGGIDNGGSSESYDIPDRKFNFLDSDENMHEIDAQEVSLYLVDIDFPKLLPCCYEDFKNQFKLPGCFPGGLHCMMNPVNVSGRPFMGPNLYIGTQSSFTHFHLDGHGTVDSAHVCLSGYNEVVMLKRLSEDDKRQALEVLDQSSHFTNEALYGLPHDRDDSESSIGWPTKENVKTWKARGYCPSVFILKPGQMVHINKGRLHAFRKLSTSTLRNSDCHHDLRQQLLQSVGAPEQLCLSVAWDWIFKGVTSEGIKNEVSSVLECSRLNRKNNLQSLAIPETSLLFLAKENVAKYKAASTHEPESLIQCRPMSMSVVEGHSHGLEPSPMTVLSAILPFLQGVVSQHEEASGWTETGKPGERKRAKISIDKTPNSWRNPDTSPLDPYGIDDFVCKICDAELSNIYMHCNGCENLLSRDFNICIACHEEGHYGQDYEMLPYSTTIHTSALLHTGSMNGDSKSFPCRCQKGTLCLRCKYCTGCSCQCHRQFTLYYRFMRIKDELQLLTDVQTIVANSKNKGSAEPSF